MQKQRRRRDREGEGEEKSNKPKREGLRQPMHDLTAFLNNATALHVCMAYYKYTNRQKSSLEQCVHKRTVGEIFDCQADAVIEHTYRGKLERVI